MRKDIEIKIRLHTLKRHDKPEGWEFDKPYIWTVFFKIDGTCIKILDNFRLKGQVKFKFGPGSHGNLGINRLGKKDTVRIPEGVGAWETRLSPLIVPHFEAKTNGVAGLIAILMEKNNLSREGAEAGHKTLNKYIEEKINGLIKGFDPRKVDLDNIEESIYDYFQHRSDQYASEIEQAVTNAVKSNQSFLRNIWSLVNSDSMIGYQIWKFNHDELISNKGHINFSHRWKDPRLGDWEIFGDTAAPDLQDQ